MEKKIYKIREIKKNSLNDFIDNEAFFTNAAVTSLLF